MDRIENLTEAEAHVFADVRGCLERIRSIVQAEADSIQEGIEILQKLRAAVYEDMNQLQHESMILEAARALEAGDFQGENVEWGWNPRQTGGESEPDLRGLIDGQPVVSAEATASAEPKGMIDRRMADTLYKLSHMPGRKYYFVRSSKMARRATTKIQKAGYDVEVRRLP